MTTQSEGQCNTVNFPLISSLRWRLVAVMVLADLIVAVTTGIVTYTTQQGSLHDQLVTRARDGASILAAGAAPSLLNRNSSAQLLLTNLVSDLPGTEGIGYAAVFGANGCVLASTNPRDLRPRLCLPLPRLSGAHTLRNGDVQAIAPVVPGAQPIGFAAVTASSKTANRDLAASTVTNVAVRAIGVLIFFLLSLAIAQYLVAPLERLARATRSLASGDLTTRIPDTGTTELATLAQTFNDMATTLEQRIRQLSFLASAGSTLPNLFRSSGDVTPILARFCDQLGACGVGLVPRHDPTEEDGTQLWFEIPEADPACAAAALQIGAGARVAESFVRDTLAFMVVPVLGSAVFVAVRPGEQPFSTEEQQVIINFAHQLGIAADNARLFESQQEALQVKDQFLSIVSHELRTPLTTIKGYAQMLRRRLTSNPTDERYAANIDAQVTRLTRLVDDLLDVTRFTRGQFELEIGPTDLRPMLEEMVNRFRIVAPNHTFQLEIEAADLLGEWDHDRLEQVFNNLLSNAVKYSPDGGTVTVSARRAAEAVTIGVRDQGIGIDQEHQRHLFERFYRAGTEGSDIKGLGLGLYVTQRIIEAHGGHIAVTSVPGQGSEFTITLPLQSVAASPLPAVVER